MVTSDERGHVFEFLRRGLNACHRTVRRQLVLPLVDVPELAARVSPHPASKTWSLRRGGQPANWTGEVVEPQRSADGVCPVWRRYA